MLLKSRFPLLSAVTVLIALTGCHAVNDPVATEFAGADCASGVSSVLPEADQCIRLNQLQVLGTHNSYKQMPAPELVELLDQTRPGWSRDIAYQHRSLTDQLERLGIRQFELDVFADPDGGLYARPAGAVLVNDQAFIDVPAMQQPGFKVLHSQDTDYRSSCRSLQACLREIQHWSQMNPGHLPIMIMLEMKEGARPDFGPIEYTVPVRIDETLLLQLDAQIRQVFPPAQLITPDEVRAGYATLAEAVQQHGWPTLAASRGRVLFAMDNTGSHREAYLAGAENLEGRAMFVSSRPGEQTAAFIKMNDVMTEYEQIREYVAAGFLVRTRADIPTREARSGSTVRRDLALASGAQYISTDYPEPSPFNPDYRVSLPGASALPGRCNPVSAPAGCRNQWLAETAPQPPRWIAGDHHIHSRYSVGWDRTQNPPTPILGGDAIYPIPLNALMARHFGLGWMVATDHGGPNHSQVNLERAYPELQQSRLVVPDVIQFFGMEFDTPGADHSSLIIPHSHDEAERLFSIESRFAKREPWPADPAWDTEPRMLEALRALRELPDQPVLIANHPARSAPALGVYGLDSPAELRRWNDTAPSVAVGMAGAPGHQAAALKPDGSLDPDGARGGYGNYPTLGGFDQFTARVGGFWDAMLSEGRDWWITANSDSHVHYSEGGNDFWPGEYSKTYVWAEPKPASILESIRAGRIFVTTGDLISELYVSASAGEEQADIGGNLSVAAGSPVEFVIRFRDPAAPNHHGDQPSVQRVDLIVGSIHGQTSDPARDSHTHTRVVARFGAADWQVNGEYREIRHTLDALDGDQFVRVRGTNTTQLEPETDPRGEDPWQDLWFYSNPVRLRLTQTNQ